MEEVKLSLLKLRKCIQSGKKKDKKVDQYTQAIGHVESHLLLLKSSILTEQLANKICSCLRRPLTPLYGAFTSSSLEFVAALSKLLYDEKILPEYTAGRHDQKARYELILTSLLSGVLDFLDEHDNVTSETKDTIGSTLFPILCSFGFSLSMPAMSVQLRCSVYSLLAESASLHKANQERLRAPSIAGGVKLGLQIWRTKDFLVLESLLCLFARMIPSTNNTSRGRAARVEFIHSVFVLSSSDNESTGQKISKMLECISTREWEPTAIQILETLASSNISFPQPFSISEVVAAGQSKPSDRLYIDGRGFCANVVVEDDIYESLEVLYDTISHIDLSFHSTDGQPLPHLAVSVHSGVAPLVGTKPISQIDNAEDYVVEFSICRERFPAFQQALKSRGLGNRINTQRERKQSIAATAAVLEVDSDGKLLGKDERYENLSQFYGTNDPSEELSNASEENPVQKHAAPTSSSPRNTSEITTTKRDSVSESGHQPSDFNSLSATVAKCPSTSKSARAPTRTFSKQLRDAAFGTSDEELSEIEWTQDPTTKTKVLADTEQFEQESKAASYQATMKAILNSDSDSDSDSDVIDLKRPTRAKAIKKSAIRKNTMLSDDEIENSSPLAAKTALNAHRTRLTVASITPPIRPASISFSKAKVQPKESKHDKEAVKPSKSLDVSPVPTDLPDAPTTSSRSAIPVVRELRKRPAKPVPHAKAALRKVVFDSPGLPVSSPVAPLQSVKARLRKRDGTPAEPSEATVKKPKRKRNKASEEELHEEHPNSDHPPAKKLKTLPASDRDNTLESADTLDPRPPKKGPGKAPKRYKGKKRRGSLTSDPPSDLVDYDAIPVDPPANTTEATPPPKLVPKAKRTTDMKSKKNTKKRPEDQLHSDAVDKENVTSISVKPTVKPETRSGKSEKRVDEAGVAKATPASRDSTIIAARAKNVKIKISPEEVIKQDDLADTSAVNEVTETKQPLKEADTPHTSIPDEPTMVDMPLDFETSAVIDSEPMEAANDPVVHVLKKEMITDNLPSANRREIMDRQIQTSAEDLSTIQINTNRAQLRPMNSTPKPREIESDVTMIDLTIDESPLKLNFLKQRLNVQPSVIDSPARGILRNETTPKFFTNQVKPSVTFSSMERSRESLFVEKTSFPSKNTSARPNKPVRMPSPEPLVKKPHVAKTVSPGMEEITAVLDQLGDAVLRRITGKFNNAREQSYANKDRLLLNAADDLERMHVQSIERFNILIQLEAEYSSLGRNMKHAFESFSKASASAEDDLKAMLEQHDRSFFVGKMPKSLFAERFMQ